MYIKQFNALSPDQILNTWLAESHMISNKLRYTPTDKGFKPVQIAYLVVIKQFSPALLRAIYANQAAGKA